MLLNELNLKKKKSTLLSWIKIFKEKKDNLNKEII